VSAAVVEAPAPEVREGALGVLDELLRDRRALIARIAAGQDLECVVRTLLVCVIVAGAVFGGVIGGFRGGRQVAYAAIKMPLVLLLTAALAAPALHAVGRVFGRRARFASDMALALAVVALCAMLLGALSPVLWLAFEVNPSYHRAALWVTWAVGIAGLLSVGLLYGGLLQQGRRFIVTGLAFLVVYGAVGSQMAWTLRPWLLRPRSPEPVFVRGLEGSFGEAVQRTERSSRGHFDGELPEGP
jgi:hypothetical protein